MQNGLWIIPLLVFVLAFAKSWNIRESINETVVFSVAYMVSLGVIFVIDLTPYDYISTSPAGIGGVVAMLIGFLAMWIQHRRWRKEQKIRQVAVEEARKTEAARRAAGGLPPASEGGVIAGAFRFAGSVQRSRKNSKRQSRTIR